MTFQTWVRKRSEEKLFIIGPNGQGIYEILSTQAVLNGDERSYPRTIFSRMNGVDGQDRTVIARREIFAALWNFTKEK